tara:strand:- start:49 stop:621 length:573 start_codon:yes stop_codon:yes gene_type:complete
MMLKINIRSLIYFSLVFLVSCSQTLENTPVKKTEKKDEAKLNKEITQPFYYWKNKIKIHQVKFCELAQEVNIKIEKFRKERNYTRIKGLETQFAQDADGLLPNGYVNDWIVKVNKVQNISTKADLILEMQCPILIYTEINMNDPIIQKVSRGSFLLISGKTQIVPVFLKDNKVALFNSLKITLSSKSSIR